MAAKPRLFAILAAGLMSLAFGACSETAAEGGTNTNWIHCDEDVDCPSRFECVEERCVQRSDLREAGVSDGAVIPSSEASPPSSSPPPRCVPPCIWEVVKDCLPAPDKPCFVQEVDGAPYLGKTTVLCQPDTGWQSANGWLGGFGMSATRSLFSVRTSPTDVCYGVSTYQFRPDIIAVQYGTTAVKVGDSPIMCTSLTALADARWQPGDPPPDGVEYYDGTVPDDTDCNGYNAGFYPTTACADAVPGTCVEEPAPAPTDGGS